VALVFVAERARRFDDFPEHHLRKACAPSITIWPLPDLLRMSHGLTTKDDRKTHRPPSASRRWSQGLTTGMVSFQTLVPPV
jgi:hypothetical protein